MRKFLDKEISPKSMLTQKFQIIPRQRTNQLTHKNMQYKKKYMRKLNEITSMKK